MPKISSNLEIAVTFMHAVAVKHALSQQFYNVHQPPLSPVLFLLLASTRNSLAVMHHQPTYQTKFCLDRYNSKN